ncbi:DNA/RNA non-specific endonuclease [Azospirillum sp. sgz302134]
MRTLALSTGLAAFLLFATGGADAASTACPAHFLGGQAPDLVNPKLAAKTRDLCFSEFAVLHSGLTRTALYSADHLTARRVAAAKHQHRTEASDTFHEDARLPGEERALLSDYARSGYDRGHLTPAADFDDPVSQGESFSLANMIPQVPENNRGVWAELEIATRTLAERHGEAWVVTLPVFAGAQTRWLRNRVAIPARIAKAVYIPALNGAAAYLTDNAPGSAWQAVSIAQLRDMTGIDVFPALPEAVKQTAIQLPAPMARGRRGGA